MQSDNVKRARELIARYPEVFESLLEFERTKKIPKLYRRKRLNITIDENTLRDFKEYASRKGLNISKFLENMMINKMGKQI